MALIKDNTIFDQTSFLEGSNSAFIEELYLKYAENPENIPQSWRVFFDGLNENAKNIKTEIKSPSWSPKKNNFSKKKYKEDVIIKEKNFEIRQPSNGTNISDTQYEKEKEQSVKSISLLRAYRIRGH